MKPENTVPQRNRTLPWTESLREPETRDDNTTVLEFVPRIQQRPMPHREIVFLTTFLICASVLFVLI